MKPTHLLAALFLTALIASALIAPAAAFSGAGSGTEASPYIITTPAQLQEINNDLDGYYKLGNNIDMSGFNWSPVSSFSGVLDGDGYTISNLILNTVTQSNGLFLTGGSVINLKFDTINFDGSTSVTGLHYICPVFNSVSIESCEFININLKLTQVYTSNKWGSNIPCIFSSSDITNTIFNDISVSAHITHDTSPTSYDDRRGAPSIAYNSNVDDCFIDGITLISSDNRLTSTGKLHIAPFNYYRSTVKTITNTVILNGDLTTDTSRGTVTCYRVWSIVDGGASSVTASNYANNVYWNDNMISSSSISSQNGNTVTETTAETKTFYQNTLGWDFANTWYWDESANLPKLQVFGPIPPTISAVTASPATGGQLTEYTLSATATTEAEGGITSYQWSYSTDSGNTWQAITGATTASYQWTPGNSIEGDVYFKVLVTGANSIAADSWEEGFTSVKTTVNAAPAISSVSVSRPLQKVNSPTTLTAIFADNQQATYQWYYQVAGGSWQAITGATEPTATWTPMVTGTLGVKIIATNQYGESSELSTTLTVLQTYTPTPITQTTFDASIDSSAKYQGVQQFTLSAELKALNYYTSNLAHLAHDNALYYLDSAEREVIPVSNTTGGTISAAYLGQYTGIITDTAGNTAFYSYQSNDWQYIEQNNAQIIASTSSYAATVSGGTLRIYNLNGNLVASTATTAANLAGNDQTNVFVSYSGNTITYYWINGNSIISASQTLTHSITELHQITGTGNFIISTAANTYIVEITDAGVYSLITTSDTETPLLNTQSTSINVFIGTSGNEIYIIGADGETDGTYVAGSTLMDASISKATGLYALAGGADYQVYILAKSQSSTWQLQQVVAFGSAIDFSQISTTGTYAAISTGLKLYLLEAVDVSTGTYMLQGAVIGSSGSPYAGKLITINGDQIRTDTSGRFLYPVTPGILYTIIADTTTTEYTASNAALQQIAIRLKPNPYAQSVSYSATYNKDTGNFEMLYEDTRDLTQSVTWTIRETGNSTAVYQVTVPAGTTATWPVPFDKTFTGYQITMDASRGSINVENVWMITPAGSQPINIPGLDDTGKNIIFGCVLMIISGLFGVMFSTKGAIFVAVTAGVMTFLGLLSIPWELIMFAGLLAILAALAKGAGGS